MKIVLINSNFEGIVTIPNLGLIFLASYLKKNSDCYVETIEPKLQNLNEQQILQKVYDANYVGLSYCTEARFQAIDFAKKVKEVNKDCRIILGGPHVKTLAKMTIERYPQIDIIVDGEGEETLWEIIKGKTLSDIKGIVYRDGNKTVVNEKRPLLPNLDDLPYEYDAIYQYLKNWKDAEVSEGLMKLRHMPIIASRGCPFNCAFCGAHDQWERKWRSLSPKELVDRMEFFKNKYKIDYFRFYDALFIGNEEKINEFCDLLDVRKLNVNFRIDIRVGTKEQLLKRLKEVGCKIVGFGVESGSNKILKITNKRITREQTIETINLCRKLGYWTIGFFMVSFPEETFDDVEQTKSLIKYFDRVNIQYFKIHPNTIFYERFKQNGDMTDEQWFDRNFGTQTIFGHEIYHCKELFPKSAKFSNNEAEELVRSLGKQYWETRKLTEKIKYVLKNPQKALNKICKILAINKIT